MRTTVPLAMIPKWVSGLLCILLPVLCLPRTSWGAEVGPRPDLLLVTVDTLRADALGWVSGNGLTPHLDRLAEQGFRIGGAVSPAPLTAPVHASLMTGLLPREHGVRDNGQPLGVDEPTLAEHLKELGYSTLAVVSGYPLTSVSGLDRGFDLFDDEMDVELRRLERRGDRTTAAALKAVQSLSSPYFVWVHYYDPHDPYQAPEGYEPGYSGEVRFVDAMIGRLLEGLGNHDKEPEITVFAADHGESLGEHGEMTHGFFLYESTMSVPVIFHAPGLISPGQSGEAFRLLDVAPTLLSLAGLPPLPARTSGIDLLGLVNGEAVSVPPAYLESRRPWRSYRWAPLAAIREGDWKLIAAPRPELYNLREDPGESKNLILEERQTAFRLRQQLKRIEAVEATVADPIDETTLERLEGLGYIGNRSSVGNPIAQNLPDPKDRIAIWNELGEAVKAVEKGDLVEAISLFDAVLEEEPDNPFALSRSGAALLLAGDSKKACARLTRAAELTPDDPLVHKNLADAWARLGVREREIESLFEVVRLTPGSPSAWARLAKALGQDGRSADAVEALSRAVEVHDRPEALLTQLSFAEFSMKRYGDASRHLRQVAELQREDFRHYAALGLMLVADGQPEEAIPWLSRSRRDEAEYASARLALARILRESGDRAGAERELEEALSSDPLLAAVVESDPALAGLLEEKP